MRKRPSRDAPLTREADDLEDVLDVVALGARQPREECFEKPLVAPERELEVLEHRQPLEHRWLLELAADSRLGNLRLRQLEQVDLTKKGRAPIGPCLPGHDVHHRRLPPPLGADHPACPPPPNLHPYPV